MAGRAECLTLQQGQERHAPGGGPYRPKARGFSRFRLNGAGGLQVGRAEVFACRCWQALLKDTGTATSQIGLGCCCTRQPTDLDAVGTRLGIRTDRVLQQTWPPTGKHLAANHPLMRLRPCWMASPPAICRHQWLRRWF